MLELRTHCRPLPLGEALLERHRVDPGYVDCVVDEAELVVSLLVLEVIAILGSELLNELDDLGSRPRDLDRVGLDVNDLNALGLQSLLEVDHEQRAALGNDVVDVANIAERVVELCRSETVDDVDHDLQRVGELISSLNIPPLVRDGKEWRQLTVEHLGGFVELLALDRDASFDEVF